MEIIRNIEVPTGNILVVQGERGKLECLSLGDYGKDVNIKCDALGLSRVPDPVRHTALLPLEEKWVITVSTQYGCSMGCTFCDVPKVGPGVNATVGDILWQVHLCRLLHPEVSLREIKRLNLHYARMGEPTWNWNVLYATYWLSGAMANISKPGIFHPVVSTMLPKGNTKLLDFLREWMLFKNGTDGHAGLQLSINSTNPAERYWMFGGSAMALSNASDLMDMVFAKSGFPIGRKVTLNFAVANYVVDAQLLADLFPPKYFICKLTPMHKTAAATANGIATAGDYTEYAPYADLEQRLKDVGYDVLVFIASKEEDESRITCGNAILADR
jgi:23S rRNA (adenine2503-C2)-methyltransferase